MHPDIKQLNFQDIGKPELIADGFLFTEGPAWNRAGQYLLFSDIDGNTIYKLSLPNTIEIFRRPSNNANGLAFDTSGLLLAAEHEPGHVTRTHEDGSIEVIASHYMGLRLNSPNDIAVRSDGTIYFTDPPYGLVNRKAELDFMGLYRIDQKGDLFLEAKYYHNPNGLAFSPDEKTLYLALTVAGEVLALDVAENGATSNPRRFALVSRPDGITVDMAGNVYIAGVNGVEVFRWDGAHLGTIITERRPANCTFAGEDGRLLVITARDCLYSVRMPIPGL